MKRQREDQSQIENEIFKVSSNMMSRRKQPIITFTTHEWEETMESLPSQIRSQKLMNMNKEFYNHVIFFVNDHSPREVSHKDIIDYLTTMYGPYKTQRISFRTIPLRTVTYTGKILSRRVHPRRINEDTGINEDTEDGIFYRVANSPTLFKYVLKNVLGGPVGEDISHEHIKKHKKDFIGGKKRKRLTSRRKVSKRRKLSTRKLSPRKLSKRKLSTRNLSTRKLSKRKLSTRKRSFRK